MIKATGGGFKAALNPSDLPRKHQQFFRDQLMYYIDQESNNLFVHAGFNRQLPFAKQRTENYYWDRGLWNEALRWELEKKLNPDIAPFEMVTSFNEIFIGHTSTMNWQTGFL